MRKLPLNLVVSDGEGGAALSVLANPKGEYAVLYRERFNWSFSSFVKHLARDFAVSEEVAKKLYCLYHRGELSEHAQRAFKRTVEPALGAFFGELEKSRIKGAVYVDTPHALPVSLPHKHGKAVLEGTSDE